MNKPTPRRWKPQFIAVLRDTANVRLACSQSGVSRSTAYRYRAKHVTFAASWDEAIEDALDRIEAKVFAASIEGDMQTARWLLSRRRPEVYGDKVALEHSGAGGKPLTFTLRLGEERDDAD